ncbi:hypothetical protein APHAL10511_005342 [Amanita phalloides]|nr:hypothetical protein APHAL10511_005342 [Amanita phalloides]
MYNGWEQYSPNHGAESYPTPAPSPQRNSAGIPLAPGAPRMRPIPLQPTDPDGPRLHPLLVYANCPNLVYDVRRHPRHASARNARMEWLHEPAISPVSEELVITCRPLSRTFVVRPSTWGYHYVTVHDVLLAVHHGIQEVGWAVENPNNISSWITGGGGEPVGMLMGGQISFYGNRFKWKGLSEYTPPRDWFLHIE